jgi:OPA family glycerol-3-phosphate transporter-like MFS transporter
MESSNQTIDKKRAVLLIFLAWLVYTTSYLGKVNYSANITQIIDFYRVTKTQAGCVPTFFFFAYGTGQVLNGLFCKRYNIKWTVFSSLIISAAINLTVAISENFEVIKWLWLVNGLVLSMLWPTLIRLISEVLPSKRLGTASIVMGTTVASGTIIIYALSSLYAAFDMFKLSFYTAGIAVIIVAIIWMFLYNSATAASAAEKEIEDIEKPKTGSQKKIQQTGGEKKLLFASVYALCFCAVGVNLIKDGLTTWVPSILKEEFFMSDSLSILLTLLLPVIAVFGNACALRIHKKVPDYINHCAIVFAIIAAFIGIIIGSLALEFASVMLFGLVAVNFFASSLNNLITSIFPLFMRGKVNSGLFAGILNGFCYVGSTLSAYGLGAVADKFGWTAVFVLLLVFCFMTFAVWGVYTALKFSVRRRLKKDEL